MDGAVSNAHNRSSHSEFISESRLKLRMLKQVQHD